MKKDPYRRIVWIYDLVAEPAAGILRRIALGVYPPRENIYILDASSAAMLGAARRKLGDSAELSLQDISHMTFPDRMFDLVTLVLVLHELPALLRPAVLTECKRVLKADGCMLLIDYHFGPYSFPLGSLLRIPRRFMEMGVGREHYANYRDFQKRGGLAPLLAETRLSIDKRVVALGGVAAIHLLRP
jgi:ubiquinone/menaquinone biosynthesis C-methylase UbiE